MERLTNRDKEIPLPNADNALFWARVYEKLAKYEDAEEQSYFASKPKTYCEKYPTGCMSCDLRLCDGKKDKYYEILDDGREVYPSLNDEFWNAEYKEPGAEDGE